MPNLGITIMRISVMILIVMLMSENHTTDLHVIHCYKSWCTHGLGSKIVIHVSGSSAPAVQGWLQDSPAGGVCRVSGLGESDRVPFPQSSETDHCLGQGELLP